MRLGEISGTTAVNVPGSPDGTWSTTSAQNATSLIINDSNKAFTDNNNSRYVRYPDDARTDMAAGMTLVLWFNSNHDPAGSKAIWGIDTDGSTSDAFQMTYGSSRQPGCQIYDRSAAQLYTVSSGASISLATTHMVACRWSAATGVCISVDGGASTCTTANFTIEVGTTVGAQVNCYPNTTGFCDNGQVTFDEPAYFKSRLTDQNVTDLYQAGSVGCNTPTPATTNTPTLTPTSTPTPTTTPTSTPNATTVAARKLRYRAYMHGPM